MTYLYHEYRLPKSDSGYNVRVIFEFDDKRLFLACVMILTHCGFDPYFSLATNNMSSRLPVIGQ